MYLVFLQAFMSVLCTCKYNWERMDSKFAFSIEPDQFSVTCGELFFKKDMSCCIGNSLPDTP